jgi:hypothetical protein
VILKKAIIMLNDKHIEQWAEYLVEEFMDNEQIKKISQDLWNVFIQMYKKGYQDCFDDKNWSNNE